ncbi:MAG: radical SAM protein [bacterium]
MDRRLPRGPLPAGPRRGRPELPWPLYVHIPFCWSMAPTAGCNVVISKDQSRGDAYLADLAVEMDRVVETLGRGRPVRSLHLGGGTPTFLSEAQLDRLAGLVTDRFSPEATAELSVEINPSVTSLEQLRTLRRLGFNRLSMGVQDLDLDVQDAIRRTQSFEDTQRFVDYARGLGFGSINFDLIYGLPRQTTRSWAGTLDQVLALRPDRLAVYSFAFVPEQRKNQRVLPAAELPRSGRAKIDLFRQALPSRRSPWRPHTAIGMNHFALPTDELAQASRRGRLWRSFRATVRGGDGGVRQLGHQRHRRRLHPEHPPAGPVPPRPGGRPPIARAAARRPR